METPEASKSDTLTKHPKRYVNIAPLCDKEGKPVPDLSQAPADNGLPHPYINIHISPDRTQAAIDNRPPLESTSTPSPSTLSSSTTTTATTQQLNGAASHARVVSKASETPPPTANAMRVRGDTSNFSSTSEYMTIPVRRHQSEVKIRNTNTGGVAPAVAEAKLKILSSTAPNSSSTCESCGELSRLLAMWEIGVSGLTRNYSRILAHLIKTRDASIALECRLNQAGVGGAEGGGGARGGAANGGEEGGDRRGGGSPKNSRNTNLAQSPKVPKNRQSMYGSSSADAAAANSRDLAENMYPKRGPLSTPDLLIAGPPATNSAPPSSPLYTKDLKDLNMHLEEAIDLCQQLAAACFKSNHLSTLADKSLSQSSSPATSARKDSSPTIGSFKPSLQAIAESKSKLTESVKKRTLERNPSAPGGLEYSGDFTSSSDSHTSDSSYVKVNKDDIPSAVRGVKGDNKQQQQQQEQQQVNGATSGSPLSDSTEQPAMTLNGDGNVDDFLQALDPINDPNFKFRANSILSSVSTYSDADVKYVMSKIASLEEERFKLLETVDKLQEDNTTVRSKCMCTCGEPIAYSPTSPLFGGTVPNSSQIHFFCPISNSLVPNKGINTPVIVDQEQVGI